MLEEKVIKENLSRYRKEKGLTQEEMADRIGLRRNAYRNIEKGKAPIVNPHLARIAAAMDMSPDELLLGYRPADPRSPQLQDPRAFYEGRLSATESEFRQRLEEKDRQVARLQESLESLKEQLQDKKEIIAYLKSKQD